MCGNISKNKDLAFVPYEDYHNVLKSLDSNKIITNKEINCSNYTVSRWSSIVNEFIFRMTGDGHGTDQQDLFIWLFNSYTYEHENLY
ncbi:hypothetical protein MBCUT_02660 [Methanobrevibacter cuticularis]|uniref:Uncharacterized protein n=1 Tax=Methanobrevibacter cuticularis TaxID=47311 RepID=A0A166F7K8_9EURY|nr:hypothetical protein [Methanobrevibacter cuticularis]KZX17398.1 hypothetical protein MBCUT_02660 [Methanobrevibacter cuticularis]